MPLVISTDPFPLFQAFYLMLQNQSFSRNINRTMGWWAHNTPLVLQIWFWYNVFVKSFLLFTATQHCHWLWPFISGCGIPLQQRKSMPQHVSAKGCNNMSLVGFVFQFQLLFSLSFILFYYLFLLFAHSPKHKSPVVGYFLQMCIADL